MGGIRDEVAPRRGDALEAVDGPRGEAGEDFHDEVICEEASRRRRFRIRRRVRRPRRLLLLPRAFLVHGSA